PETYKYLVSFHCILKLPQTDAIKLLQVKAGALIVKAALKTEDVVNSWTYLNCLPAIGKGINFFPELFDAAHSLICLLFQEGYVEEPQNVTRFMNDIAASDAERYWFAKSVVDAVTSHCSKFNGFEAFALFSSFIASKDMKYNILKNRCGHILIQYICEMRMTNLAIPVFNALVDTKGVNEVVDHERCKAGIRMINSYIYSDKIEEAVKFFKEQHCFKSSEFLTSRWLSGAEKIITFYVNENQIKEAANFYFYLCSGEPHTEMNVLTLYSIGEKIIWAYCDRGDFKNAQRFFNMLPKCGSSLKLFREKFEIITFLVLYYIDECKLKHALKIYNFLPESSQDTRVIRVKSRIAVSLIKAFSSSNKVVEASQVYESLVRLGDMKTRDLTLAKAAFILSEAYRKHNFWDKASELLESIPGFCDPTKIKKELSTAISELADSMFANKEVEKANHLLSVLGIYRAKS
ncbi:MAG: hypothetical protein LBF22_04530, partial [Deltaproteobacteria bacterium]|nr:hypothetical protein [Deltaproteobacteria bacterium]